MGRQARTFVHAKARARVILFACALAMLALLGWPLAAFLMFPRGAAAERRSPAAGAALMQYRRDPSPLAGEAGRGPAPQALVDFADELAGRDTGAERPATRLEKAALIFAGSLCGAALAGLLLVGASAVWKVQADPLPPKRPAVEAGATRATRPAVEAGAPAEKAQSRAQSAPVRVIDGDTIEVGGETIRLADIDTPERGARAECDAEARLAELATTRLRILLAEQTWRIERELKRDGTPKLDRYERSLAILVYEPGGGSVGMTLVAEGYAVAWEGRRHDWCGSGAR